MLKQLALGPWSRTLRYCTSAQLFARLHRARNTLYFASPLFPLLEEKLSIPEQLSCPPPILWQGDKKHGQAIAQNTFTFYGRTIAFGGSVEWFPKNAPVTWQRALHGFAYLNDLHSLKNNEGRDDARRLMQSWLTKCSSFNRTSWHPDALSERLIHWLTYYNWVQDGMSAEVRQDVMESLAWQTEVLSRLIAWDRGGHVLIHHLKALIYAGLCLPGRQSVYLDAMVFLLEQLPLQILPDGGHYERSPLFHVQVLKDLLDIHALILKSGHTPPLELDQAIERMADALAFLRYPDGQLGLFNDSTLGNKEELDAIAKRSGSSGNPVLAMPDMGYVRLHRGETFLFADTGVCSPDHITQHSHADTLSFEMMLGHERVIVNSGTFALEGQERLKFRATAAHSTATANKKDSSEVWHEGRLGRRVHEVICSVKEEAGTGIGLEASHDGYRAFGITHTRRIFLSEDGQDIRGEDVLSATGKRSHHVNVHFHLAPGTSVHLKSQEEVLLKTPKGQNLSFRVQGARLHDAQSVYAPHFGVKIESRQLVLRGKWVKQACTMRWAIKVLNT